MATVGALIPLFPLNHVLLPGMPLPLHIFEQRYKDLLLDVRSESGYGGFGVVALRSGTEAVTPLTVVEGPDVQPTGTLAEILEVEQQSDGASDLLSVGSRRFRLLRVVPAGTGDTDKAYLRGAVEYLDEPDGALTPQLETRARELIEVYDEALVRLAGRATGSELPDDANQLSYHLAARLPLPPEERQELLDDPTTAERLQRVSRLLRREIALLRGTRSIAVSPAVLRMITGAN